MDREALKRYLEEKYARDRADAEARAAEGDFAADLGQAAGNLGYAIAGVDAPDNSKFYGDLRERNAKMVEGVDAERKRKVEDYLTRKQMDADAAAEAEAAALADPNDVRAKVSREILGKMGASLPEDATYGQTKDIQGLVKDSYQFGESAKDRDARAATDAEYKAAMLGLKRDQLETTKGLGEKRLEYQYDKKAMLSDKQTSTIASYDQAIAEVDGILAQHGSVDTGPLSAAQNSMAKVVGMDDPAKTAFRARVGDQLAQYIKNISGAAVTDKERQELLKNVPSMSDNDAQFKAKAERLSAKLKNFRAIELQNIEKQGKDAGAFAGGAKTVIKTEKSPSTGKTRVTYSDGTTEIK